MQHWGGHRLGLTCRALLRRLSADNYVVETHYVGPNEKRLTVCHLPNGVFHGSSRFDAHEFATAEYVAVYDRGDIQHIDMRWVGAGKRVINRQKLIRGYSCIWYVDAVYIGSRAVACKIPADDLERFVRKYLDQGNIPHSMTPAVPVLNEWIASVLPQTYYPDSQLAKRA